MNHPGIKTGLNRRACLGALAAAGWAACQGPFLSPAWSAPEPATNKPASAPVARIAVTLDLEMSREYPQRGMREWDYRKGDLDQATKAYSVEAARIVKSYGGKLHFFLVGQVLEQPDISWLTELAAAGHPIGNHTYDHVNVMAQTPEETQFRFRRAPWLVQGKSVEQILRENITMTREAMRMRASIADQGFRTPGGFYDGLSQRPDLQNLLRDLGFTWASTKYPAHPVGTPKTEPTEEIYAGIVQAQRQAQPFVYPSGLVEIPMSPISDVNAFRSHFWQREWFLRAVDDAISWAISEKAVFDFLAHPSCMVVEDPNFETFHLIGKRVREAGEKATLVDLDTIAQAYGKPT